MLPLLVLPSFGMNIGGVFVMEAGEVSRGYEFFLIFLGSMWFLRRLTIFVSPRGSTVKNALVPYLFIGNCCSLRDVH